MLREEFEYLEFLICKLDSVPVEGGFHSPEVNANPVKGGRLASLDFTCMSDCRAHSREQFSRTKGLRYTIVSSQLEEHDLVEGIRCGTENDNRQSGQLSSNLPTNILSR